jgi:hypothetical protein
LREFSLSGNHVFDLFIDFEDHLVNFVNCNFTDSGVRFT